MFELLDNGTPLLHRFIAKYVQEIPLYNPDGTPMEDMKGQVMRQVENTTIFCAKEDVDRFIADNPQLSIDIENIDIDGKEWIERYAFTNPADVHNALNAGEGCNIFFFEKDAIHRANAIINLKLHGIEVDETLYKHAIEFITRR